MTPKELEIFLTRFEVAVEMNKIVKEEKGLLHTESSRTGYLCKNGTYSADSSIGLIPTAKGWQFEQDLARLQKRKEVDSVSPPLRPVSRGVRAALFSGDADRSEKRLFATTLIMLREFSMYKYVKEEATFVDRYKDKELTETVGYTVEKVIMAGTGVYSIKTQKEKRKKVGTELIEKTKKVGTGVWLTKGEQEEEAKRNITTIDAKELSGDAEKLARFRLFFGIEDRKTIATITDEYGEDHLAALLRAIIRVEGWKAFATKGFSGRAKKKISAEEQDSIRSAKEEQILVMRTEEDDFTIIKEAITSISKDIEKQKVANLLAIKEAHMRFKVRKLLKV